MRARRIVMGLLGGGLVALVAAVRCPAVRVS